MKTALWGLTILALLTPVHRADAADMLLRDAIYLYGQEVRSQKYVKLTGRNCDVLELVLDVESGHTDIEMLQDATSSVYPDRIYDYHEMFAYALYGSIASKSFSLGQKQTAASSDTVIGKATAFAYCFSTNPAASVLKQDALTGSCTDSRGTLITCP
jgi:hypothetical protein